MDISKSTHTALPSTVSAFGENKYLTKATSNYLASFFEQKLEITLSKLKISLLADSDLGSAYPQVLNSLAMSRIFLEVAELNEAQKFLSEARVLIRQTGSSQLAFNLSMLQAELFFTVGKNGAGLDELSKVMRTGRKNKYFDAGWLHPNMMSELCLKALQNHIEIDYVQQLIKKQHLIPGKSAFDLKTWPWKVRVYTFGRFSVLLNDKPVDHHSKGKNKPIELLKVLIALGGRNIAEPQISEILWPDVDGDQAHSSFTTTLSRLRKVLGKKTLAVHDGHLTLNDHFCWVDSWAFERKLGELETILADANTRNISHIEPVVDRIFTLYHGLFMENEKHLSWLISPRNRLQTRLLRMIKQLIGFYSRHGGQCLKVIALYEKAQELDPHSEEYCRGLMQCHAAQGNRGEALDIYTVYRDIIKTTFNIRPSSKTEQLYQTIKTGNQKQLKRACNLCSQAVS